MDFVREWVSRGRSRLTPPFMPLIPRAVRPPGRGPVIRVSRARESLPYPASLVVYSLRITDYTGRAGHTRVGQHQIHHGKPPPARGRGSPSR